MYLTFYRVVIVGTLVSMPSYLEPVNVSWRTLLVCGSSHPCGSSPSVVHVGKGSGEEGRDGLEALGVCMVNDQIRTGYQGADNLLWVIQGLKSFGGLRVGTSKMGKSY